MGEKKNKQSESQASRREFLKLTGIVTLGVPFVPLSGFESAGVSMIINASDSLVSSAPVQWAVKELEETLQKKNISVSRYETIAQAKAGTLIIATAGMETPLAKQLLATANAKIPNVPEALGLMQATLAGKKVLLATGSDASALVYALLELTDRVNYSPQALAALNFEKPVIEKPANAVRSLTRLFTSDVEDKPWYNDKEMWPAYLTMLATQRFNRFNLSLGIGYDFLQRVTDAYFIFAYPFFFSLPGYNVKVPQLPDSERDSNFAMLKYISEQTASRGMQFQLGLWMHGYEWLNTTNANYTIEGLNKENHGAYCRDAIKYLLQACPAISGVTFRVHGESGVTEGSYDFWKSIFEGVKSCGRRVRIDMHAKGMDQTMIDTAVNTGLPITISPKYWAEHMGMPYHQADIRSLEVPDEKKQASALMSLSAGSRSFLRYGYGDLLKEGRPYKVIHRIWPGTQRLLLWGDPVTARAHAKAFSFCGSDGVELMEPLSFKGRRGSGIAGDRCGYADASLKPKWDWEKYVYTLRIFGRLIYNPDASPQIWQRYLQNKFGGGAVATETALANATRILPTVLTAHGPSAANNTYWPEMYTNQPITDLPKNIYSDTIAPKIFANVTPFDPQLFLSSSDFVKESLAGESSGKYNPVEVAQWLEDYAANAEKALAEAEIKSTGKNTPEFRRMKIDVQLQIGLGRFFASKFRAAVLYAIYQEANDKRAVEEAIIHYRKAKDYWSALAEKAKDVYQRDVTVGELACLRGHWMDRLPAIAEDLTNMEKKLAAYEGSTKANTEQVNRVLLFAKGRSSRQKVFCRHDQPKSFASGSPLDLAFIFDEKPVSAVLFYRHVNQAERYQNVPLSWKDNCGSASIPAEYTKAPFPLAYYINVRYGSGETLLYPGFSADHAGQPYFVLRKS